MSRSCSLDHFGFLSVSGKDAVKFLQGYTTCDLHSLTPTHAQLGAICNLQGRMLTSFLIAKHDNDLLLRMDRALIGKTIDFLSKYIVFSKAELKDVSESLRCIGLLDCEPSPIYSCQSTEEGIEIGLGQRREKWVPVAGEIEPSATLSDWSRAEIDAGFAWVTSATTEQFLPQMFNYHQLRGVDFEKGCYLGQEIVARMQYRGELKRRLHSLTSEISRMTGQSLSGGMIVASSMTSPDCQLLAVLQNPEADEIQVRFEDGEETVARPVQVSAES